MNSTRQPTTEYHIPGQPVYKPIQISKQDDAQITPALRIAEINPTTRLTQIVMSTPGEQHEIQ